MRTTRSNKASPAKLKVYRERSILANDLLRCIASHGRRFFSQRSRINCGDVIGRISCFEVDEHGRVWFVNAYNGARVFLDGPNPPSESAANIS